PVYAHHYVSDAADARAIDSVPTRRATALISISKSHTGTINEGTAGQTLVYHFTVTNTSTASTDPVTLTSLSDTVLGNLLPAFTADHESATLNSGDAKSSDAPYSLTEHNAG